jgi:uncharacterized protein YutE (UPF0331/DUF86 family)
LFDIAWSCNSGEFYYLIDNKIEEDKIPQFIQYVHTYLLDLCTKINDYVEDKFMENYNDIMKEIGL